ncbi:transposase [Cystobacter fuscus]
MHASASRVSPRRAPPSRAHLTHPAIARCAPGNQTIPCRPLYCAAGRDTPPHGHAHSRDGPRRRAGNATGAAHAAAQGLKRLCRYGARGALALERLKRAEDGRIAYRMKRPLPDGTTHLLFTGLEL